MNTCVLVILWSLKKTDVRSLPPQSQEDLLRGLVLANALPPLEGSCSATMVILDKHPPFSALQRVKELIRKRFPSKYCLIRSPSDLFVSALNSVHVLDPDRWEVEYRWLWAYLHSVELIGGRTGPQDRVAALGGHSTRGGGVSATVGN